MTDKIQEQIDYLQLASKSIVAWGKRCGTYAPLERSLSKSADTMTKLNAVYNSARAVLDLQDEFTLADLKQRVEALSP